MSVLPGFQWIGFQPNGLWHRPHGLFIDVDFMSTRVLVIIGIMLAATAVLALIPGLSAYRASLNQGLVVRT